MFGMKLEEAVAAIEDCVSMEELSTTLQRIIENYGFSAFSFMDSGNPQLDMPYYKGTPGPGWESDYQGNLFVRADLCLSKARRTNTPFHWGSVPIPQPLGRRKPDSLRLMEAATDHGFKEGLVVPYHFIDPLGRVYSSLVLLFWKDHIRQFFSLLNSHKHELHIIMVYWAQRAIDIVSTKIRARPAIMVEPYKDRPCTALHLTDKERDVLSWAGRGKTVSDTSEIMKIADSTVETHMKSILRKMDAGNKTHAVAKAIFLGLIDV